MVNKFGVWFGLVDLVIGRFLFLGGLGPLGFEASFVNPRSGRTLPVEPVRHLDQERVRRMHPEQTVEVVHAVLLTTT